jgi:hypothetical protein
MLVWLNFITQRQTLEFSVFCRAGSVLLNQIRLSSIKLVADPVIGDLVTATSSQNVVLSFLRTNDKKRSCTVWSRLLKPLFEHDHHILQQTASPSLISGSTIIYNVLFSLYNGFSFHKRFQRYSLFFFLSKTVHQTNIVAQTV